MKTLIFLVSFILVTQPLIAAPRAPISSFVFEGKYMTCGAWVKNINDTNIMAQYDSWIRGFFTGANFETTKNQLTLKQLPDTDSINLYISSYCNNYPLNSWLKAVFELKRNLTDQYSEPPVPAPEIEAPASISDLNSKYAQSVWSDFIKKHPTFSDISSPSRKYGDYLFDTVYSQKLSDGTISYKEALELIANEVYITLPTSKIGVIPVQK